MDALVYPFFWTWKVSRILGCPSEGTLGSIMSLSFFLLTIGISTSTFASKQLARAPAFTIFFLCHTTSPKLTPIFISLPFHVTWIYRCRLIGPSWLSGQSGPCWSDSVPSITLQMPGLFFLFHNRSECPLPIDIRPSNVGFRPPFSRNGILYFSHPSFRTGGRRAPLVSSPVLPSDM